MSRAANDNEKRLCISFSGGETSAYMARLIKTRMADEYDSIVCVFANTGQENEQTLEFVDRCDREFGLGVVWIEAVTNPERGIGARARVVDFASASRDGAPFEAVIAKHGIPNKKWPHCTRETKTRPIGAYLRDMGWRTGSYDMAIGIRADEIDRVSPTAAESRIIYPLFKRFPSRKADVNAFWEKQTFRLDLKGYQGNCKWCWKKSLRKHITLLREDPGQYDFPERMEREYGLAGNNPEGRPRVFFREGRSTADLRQLAATASIRPVSDDAREYQPELFSADYDVGEGCEETCEVNFEEAARPQPRNPQSDTTFSLPVIWRRRSRFAANGAWRLARALRLNLSTISTLAARRLASASALSITRASHRTARRCALAQPIWLSAYVSGSASTHIQSSGRG